MGEQSMRGRLQEGDHMYQDEAQGAEGNGSGFMNFDPYWIR